MVIAYASSTGHTEQYAKLLQNALDIPAYNIKDFPDIHNGGDVIYLGWLFAGNIVGYHKIAKKCNVKCLIGVGMSPESAEQAQFLRKKMNVPADIPVFYLQGGYDAKKLTGINKLLMKAKTPSILKQFEGKTEEEKQASATYRMITEGCSVVSEEHLADVLAWAKDHEV